MIPGSASGLRVHDCAIAPAMASEAPTANPRIVLGTRSSHTTWARSPKTEVAAVAADGPSRSTASTSAGTVGLAPMNTDAAAHAINATARATGQARRAPVTAARRTCRLPTGW